MKEKEKLLREERVSLLRQSAELEERVNKGIATTEDKERLLVIKENLSRVSRELSELVDKPKSFRLFRKPREQAQGGFAYVIRVLMYSIVSLALIFTIAGVYIFHETGPEAIKKAINYAAEQQHLEKQLVDVLSKRIKDVKNPELIGVETITDSDGFTMIFPTTVYKDQVRSKAIEDMSHKVKSWGYDSLLVGRAYNSLGGRVFWTDFQGQDETDLEIIIDKMRSMGLKKCFAFMSNPDRRTWPDPIKNWVQGDLTIRQESVRFASILWKTDEQKIVIHSENLNGVIKGDSFKVKIDNEPIDAIQRAAEAEGTVKAKEEKKSNYFSGAYNWVSEKAKKVYHWVF